VNCLHKVSSY